MSLLSSKVRKIFGAALATALSGCLPIDQYSEFESAKLVERYQFVFYDVDVDGAFEMPSSSARDILLNYLDQSWIDEPWLYSRTGQQDFIDGFDSTVIGIPYIAKYSDGSQNQTFRVGTDKFSTFIEHQGQSDVNNCVFVFHKSNLSSRQICVTSLEDRRKIIMALIRMGAEALVEMRKSNNDP